VEIEQRLEILKKVANAAALAGIKGQIDADGKHFAMGFNTTAGRTQMVYIRPTGKTPDGQDIVTVFSPALVVKKGMFAGMSKDQAIALLRLNENTFFARFGIWESETESMVVASSDLILDTVDTAELNAHAYYVAFAADNYEAKHGADKF